MVLLISLMRRVTFRHTSHTNHDDMFALLRNATTPAALMQQLQRQFQPVTLNLSSHAMTLDRHKQYTYQKLSVVLRRCIAPGPPLTPEIDDPLR